MLAACKLTPRLRRTLCKGGVTYRERTPLRAGRARRAERLARWRPSVGRAQGRPFANPIREGAARKLSEKMPSREIFSDPPLSVASF